MEVGCGLCRSDREGKDSLSHCPGRHYYWVGRFFGQGVASGSRTNANFTGTDVDGGAWLRLRELVGMQRNKP